MLLKPILMDNAKWGQCVNIVTGLSLISKALIYPQRSLGLESQWVRIVGVGLSILCSCCMDGRRPARRSELCQYNVQVCLHRTVRRSFLLLTRENVLECPPEVPREAGVDEWIQHGVEVSRPGDNRESKAVMVSKALNLSSEYI